MVTEYSNAKVVAGQSEEDNELLFQKGELPQLEDNQPHWELIKDMDWLILI